MDILLNSKQRGAVSVLRQSQGKQNHKYPTMPVYTVTVRSAHIHDSYNKHSTLPQCKNMCQTKLLWRNENKKNEMPLKQAKQHETVILLILVQLIKQETRSSVLVIHLLLGNSLMLYDNQFLSAINSARQNCFIAQSGNGVWRQRHKL